MDAPELRIALDCGAVVALMVAVDRRGCRCGASHEATPRDFALAVWLAYQDAELEHAARARAADDERGPR